MVKNAIAHLLSQCSDHKNDKTDIKHLCDEMLLHTPQKLSILFTPKYHYELAGKGIEYSSGTSKRLFCRKPLSDKKAYADFIKLVHLCIAYISIEMFVISPHRLTHICWTTNIKQWKIKREKRSEKMTMMFINQTLGKR